jgi:chromate reductase, NAD(P)H dehydrogenase (quinone)
MNRQTRILGISGSLGRESYNSAALRAAAGLAPEGAAVETFELDGILLFNQDEEKNPPAKVVELKRRVREADALLFVTPEYNYSVPGVLKNAIDWASRPYGDNAWDGKPAAITGASLGAIGTARAQYHLRQIWELPGWKRLSFPWSWSGQGLWASRSRLAWPGTACDPWCWRKRQRSSLTPALWACSRGPWRSSGPGVSWSNSSRQGSC